MHELSIAISILESVEEELHRHGDEPLDAIHLRIGALSGVVPEALRSAYGLAAEGTPFAHARLVIEEVPIVVYCPTCARNREVQPPEWFCCPVCHTPSSDVISGRELEIAALELVT